MQLPWGNGWILILLLIAVLVALAACAPVLKEKKQQQKEYVVTIEGIVSKVIEDDTDKKGGKHQRMFVRVKKVLDNPEKAEIDKTQDILVVMRYGDKDGFPQRIQAFDESEGKRIEVRGKYIPDAYIQGKEKRAVLHFTHKPVGYVRFENKTYR
jgi:uncharacterized protein YceK